METKGRVLLPGARPSTIAEGAIPERCKLIGVRNSTKVEEISCPDKHASNGHKVHHLRIQTQLHGWHLSLDLSARSLLWA